MQGTVSGRVRRVPVRGPDHVCSSPTRRPRVQYEISPFHKRRAALPACISHRRLCRASVAEADAPAASGSTTQLQGPWYAVIANADFMLHDVQNESFAEQLRERRRLFQEQNKEIDFFLVPEPAWLDSKFPAEAKRVRRPSLALVSRDKIWITFMKLRLDRVLKLELGDISKDEAIKSAGSLPEYDALDKEKWTAPYAPYRSGWWEMFVPKPQ